MNSRRLLDETQRVKHALLLSYSSLLNHHPASTCAILQRPVCTRALAAPSFRKGCGGVNKSRFRGASEVKRFYAYRAQLKSCLVDVFEVVESDSPSGRDVFSECVKRRTYLVCRDIDGPRLRFAGGVQIHASHGVHTSWWGMVWSVGGTLNCVCPWSPRVLLVTRLLPCGVYTDKRVSQLGVSWVAPRLVVQLPRDEPIHEPMIKGARGDTRADRVRLQGCRIPVCASEGSLQEAAYAWLARHLWPRL